MASYETIIMPKSTYPYLGSSPLRPAKYKHLENIMGKCRVPVKQRIFIIT